MSAKLLIAAGVGVAVLAAGGYVGGTYYVKDRCDNISKKAFFQAQDLLAEGKVKLEDAGVSDESFSSKTQNYKVTFPGGEPIPVQIHYTYSPTTVEGKISVDDALYKAMQLDDRSVSAVKDLIQGFSARYSVLSGIMENSLTFHDGAASIMGLDVAWKAGSVRAGMATRNSGIYNQSFAMDIPFIAVDKAGKSLFKLSDLKSSSDNVEKKSAGTLTLGGLTMSFEDLGGMSMDFEGISSDGSVVRGSGDHYTAKLGTAIRSLKLELTEKEQVPQISDEDSGEDGPAPAAAVKTVRYNIALNKYELEARDLNFATFTSKCDIIPTIATGVEYQNCGAKLGDAGLQQALLSLVDAKTTLDHNFVLTVNGAEAELKSHLSVKDGADLSNPMALATSLVLNADFSLDAVAFQKPELHMESMAGIFKQYAKDPSSAKLEYHIDLKDGSLTINGKKLF